MFQQQQINRAMFEMKYSCITIGRFVDVVTVVAEEVSQSEPFDGGIVAEKNPDAGIRCVAVLHRQLPCNSTIVT